MTDSYLVYASTALVAMGAAALVLSFVFRVRLKKLKAVSQKSTATVFHRTFTVFDPYQKTTLFHRFLSVMPFIPIIGGFGLAALLLVIIDSGLLLTLLVVILALSLMVVEESLEAYAESKLLIKAVENGEGLGLGDIRLLNLTRKLLPRLAYYYIGLSAFFFASAAVLPIVWSDVLWYFAVFFGYLVQASASAGPISWLAGIILYALAITAFIILVTLAKSRLFEHRPEPGTV